MALFELERGRLIPAQFGRPVAQGLGADIMESVRSQVLEVIDRPLFPVSWRTPDGEVGPDGGPHCLTALDPSGQVVSVEVQQRLDAVTLIAALARLGNISKMGWLDLARAYPGGPQAFSAGWAEFRESMPPTIEPGPRLFLVVGDMDASVDQALGVLATAGLEIHQVSVRQMSNGRRFLEVTQVATRTFSSRAQIGSHQARPQLEWNSEGALDNSAAGYADVQVDPVTGAQPQVQVPPAQEQGQAQAAADQSDGTPAGVEEFDGAAWDGGGRRAAHSAHARPARAAQRRQSEQVSQDSGEIPADEGAQSQSGSLARDARGLKTIAQMVGTPTVLLYRDEDYRLYEALLNVDGTIDLGGNEKVTDPDAAFAQATGQAQDGWQRWRLGNLEGPTLAEAIAEINSETA